MLRLRLESVGGSFPAFSQPQLWSFQFVAPNSLQSASTRSALGRPNQTDQLELVPFAYDRGIEVRSLCVLYHLNDRPLVNPPPTAVKS